MRLILKGESGEWELPVPSPIRKGMWAAIVPVDRRVTSIAIRVPQPGAEVVPLVEQFRVTSLSRASAMLHMLVTPGTRSWRNSIPNAAICKALVQGLIRGGPGTAARAMVSSYRAQLAAGASLPCDLRLHWWSPWTVRLALQPGADLQRESSGDAAAWVSHGNDPQFLLTSDSLSRPIRKGWYLFKCESGRPGSALQRPCLYPDYGIGVSQDDLIALAEPRDREVLSQVVNFRCDVTALRFDPTVRAGAFGVSRLRLRRLGRVEAALRMLCAIAPGSRDTRGLAVTAARSGLAAAAAILHQRYQGLDLSDGGDYAAWAKLYDSTPSPAAMLPRVEAVGEGPLISVLLPVYNTPERWLRRCIESVMTQAYPRWELCIADDASPSAEVGRILAEYAARDSRVRFVRREKNGHISAASNTALAMCRGDFVALLDHDDELRPHALLEFAEAVKATPELQVMYSDEDKIDEDGKRFQPNFKPDWNPDLLLSQNYVCHLTVLSADLVRQVGGFREGFEGSQDHDLILRCCERVPARQIHHIPKVLYHWRAIAGSTALERGAKDYAAQAGAKAVEEHLLRVGADATVEELQHGHYRVRWPIPSPAPKVSLVIPTRDRASLLKVCVESILSLTRYPNFELVVVDNQSSEPDALEYIDQLRTRVRVRVLEFDAPFNYSAVNNFAIAQTDGSIIGLVNNDIEAVHEDWLCELVGHAVRPDIGAVGAMLHYPDGSIQHAGVILGIGGIANHPYTGQPRGYPGHGARALVTQNLSAVTGACLLVRRDVYEIAGGLDDRLAVAFNDIDLCLRIQALGYRNLWTPFSELIHHESASRGQDDTPEKAARFAGEVRLMHERWGQVVDRDPAYNPNLTLEGLNFELAFPPRQSMP